MLLMCCGLLISGCANEVDDSLNTLPTEDDVVMSCEGGGAFCDCAVPGRVYRMTTLALDSLAGVDGHAIIRVLNPLWAGDIGRKELNIFVEIVEARGNEVTVRLVNGLRSTGLDVPFDEGAACSKEDTAITFTAVPSEDGGFENAEPTGFNISSGTVGEPKLCSPQLSPANSILVRNIGLRAEFSEDCSQLINGVVSSAAILAEALNATCMCKKVGGTAEDCGEPIADHVNEDGSCAGCNENFQNLGELMNSLNGGLPLASDCDLEDGQEGICVSGQFEAELLTEVPAACMP